MSRLFVSKLALSAGLLLAAGCAPPVADPEPAPEPAPSLVLVGSEVRTLDPDGPRGEAVAVAGDRILAVGSERDVLAAAGSSARIVRHETGVILPAFVDHHVHLLNVGLSLRNRELGGTLFLDLSGLDREEIAARVSERAEGLSPGTWILGKGWSQGVWGAVELPDHGILTAAAPEHPVFLTRVDGHASWVNRAALERAGITAETPDPAGGTILRRPDGSPSGVLLETANDLVVPHLPKPADGDVEAAFRLAAGALAAQGVVEAFDAGFLPMPGVVGLEADLGRYLDLLAEADRDSPLSVRAHLMVPAPSGLAEQILNEPGKYRELTPRVGVTHLKLFADGALGSRGGALSRPYADDPSTTGVPRMDPSSLREWSERALDAGLDVAIHAIGDLAVQRALDAFERLLDTRENLDPRRLRLEHFSFASAEDFQRAADLGIVLSVQPNFVIPSDEGLTMEDARIGAPDAERVYAWGRARHTGALLAFGSDYFTFPGAPLLTLHAAVTRQNAQGLPPGGWHPSERIDPKAALSILTTSVLPGGELAPARIRPGAPADLVILSADPTKTSPGEILDIEVLATVNRGRVVHE